ncbi:MAG TPA: cytochrome b [Rhizomicrobium sp.]|jgi:cytochrome b561|nr:cytochrome b [Rhizomicrobium sp.]
MPAANTRTRYGSVAMTLHWLIAAAIIVNLGLGFYMADILTDQDPSRFAIIQFHKSIGLTVLALSVLRLLWRIVNPVPPLPDWMGPGLKALAHGTHYLLYFLIIAIPLTGWALASASPLGLPTNYFGLFHWPGIPFLTDLTRAQKTPLRHEFFAMHMYLAFTALVLVPLHLCSALYHQFRGDDVLRRMVPGTRVAGRA